MRINTELTENNRVLLQVNGELITWNELKKLIVIAIAVEEANGGLYPLRKDIKVICDTLKWSKVNSNDNNETELKIRFKVRSEQIDEYGWTEEDYEE